MSRLSYKIQRTVSILLLVSFFWIFYNNTFNVHVHKLPDGTVIVHAHPFKHDGKPFANHSHGKKQYTFFNLFFHFIWFLSILIHGINFTGKFNFIKNIHKCGKEVNIHFALKNKDPPFSTLLRTA